MIATSSIGVNDMEPMALNPEPFIPVIARFIEIIGLASAFHWMYEHWLFTLGRPGPAPGLVERLRACGHGHLV